MGLAYVVVGLGCQEAGSTSLTSEAARPQHRVGGTAVSGRCGLLQPGRSGNLTEVVEA